MSEQERTPKQGSMDSTARAQVGQAEDDSVLVARSRRGDQDAFAILYDRYSRLVYSVAIRVVRNAQTAEDILHDIFLQLWQMPQQFDSARGSLGPWLAVIARNRAIDCIRKQKVTIDPEETVLASMVHLGSDVELANIVSKVRELLKAMPEAQRIAMEMAFFEGNTHAEIAASMKEPLGTVKTRIRAALMIIRKALNA
jgi:RNA polymerase sigma-70 factor, ECF subfamily